MGVPKELAWQHAQRQFLPHVVYRTVHYDSLAHINVAGGILLAAQTSVLSAIIDFSLTLS
jgi:hypothetical protein